MPSGTISTASCCMSAFRRHAGPSAILPASGPSGLEAAWAGQLDADRGGAGGAFRARQRACAGDPAPPTCRCQGPSAAAPTRRHPVTCGARSISIGHIANEVDRTKAEVELRVGIGAAYMAIRGFGAPEVLEAYASAEALCDRLGERVDLFPAIWGQWMFRTGRGETDASRRLCARLLALAEKFDDAGLKIQAHHAMWSTSFVCGELGMARAHAQSGLALPDAKLHRSMASSYGNHDAACCARNFSAMSLALAGDADEARAMIDRLARRGQKS